MIDHHGHTLLTVVGLAAEDPDRLGVVDQHVENRCGGLVALDWNKP